MFDFQKLINQYLRLHLSQIFGNAWQEQDLSEIPAVVCEAEQLQLVKIADLIMNAKKPLLLIGGQAVLPPVKPGDLREVVEVKIFLFCLLIQTVTRCYVVL